MLVIQLSVMRAELCIQYDSKRMVDYRITASATIIYSWEERQRNLYESRFCASFTWTTECHKLAAYSDSID